MFSGSVSIDCSVLNRTIVRMSTLWQHDTDFSHIIAQSKLHVQPFKSMHIGYALFIPQ